MALLEQFAGVADNVRAAFLRGDFDGAPFSAMKVAPSGWASEQSTGLLSEEKNIGPVPHGEPFNPRVDQIKASNWPNWL